MALLSRVLIMCSLPLVCVNHLYTASEIVPNNEAVLIRPKSEHLSEEKLQAAIQSSVRSGAILLLEELLAPGNDSSLVVPPHAALKKVGEKIVERRYRKDKAPIYEKKRVQQLVPKKDDYGTVIGYEKKMVEVRASDKIIGYRDIEVSDPDGDIVRKITVPILDRSNKMLPRGWFGMNAQSLIIFSRCGLGNSSEAFKAANELERLMNMFGMPDTTWDLAWLTMAWIDLAKHDQDRSKRRDLLIGRLIDGAIYTGTAKKVADGMWGPLCIHHEAQEKLFRIELELQTLFQQTEAALAAATTKRKKKQLQESFRKVSTALGEIKRANAMISQQGKRLSEIERPWKMDETYKTTGLTYYMYNRDIVDIDSTAIAAMALRQAHKHDLIPEETPREKVQGKILVKGLDSEKIIAAAYNTLFDKAGEDGNYHSHTHLFPIKTYDKIPNLAGVPLAIKLPTLLRPETWHSNASAYAALQHLDSLVNERTQGRVRDREEILRKSRERILDIVDAYLKSDPKSKEWISPHNGETDSLAALSANNSWPKPPKLKKKQAAPAINDLSVGYMRSPRALLEHLRILYDDNKNQRAISSRNTLAYRLLIEQESDGSWLPQSARRVAAPGVSSGEHAYLLGKLAQRHLWQAKSDKNKKLADAIDGDFHRDGPYPYRHGKRRVNMKHMYNVAFQGEGNAPHKWGHSDYSYYSVDLRIAETLAALVYLSEGMKSAPEIDKALPKGILSRSQAAVSEYEQTLLAAQEAELTETFTEADRDKAVKKIEKTGAEMPRSDKGIRLGLHDLWAHILTSSGLTDKLSILAPPEPEVTEEVAGDDNKAEAADDDKAEIEEKAAEEENEVEKTDKALDDILN